MTPDKTTGWFIRFKDGRELYLPDSGTLRPFFSLHTLNIHDGPIGGDPGLREVYHLDLIAQARRVSNVGAEPGWQFPRLDMSRATPEELRR